MSLKIGHKILLMMVVFFLAPVIMFGATSIISEKQKKDGLVINLAGRQRMLSQKMSKESLTFIHQTMMKHSEDATKTKAGLLNTMEVFERTLNGLKNSGSVPTSLDLKGAAAQVPAARGDAIAQLQEVEILWTPFKAAVLRLIESKLEDDVQVVLKNNLPLLKAANGVVTIMQDQAEANVKLLFVTQGVCLLLGLGVVIFVLIWSRAKIVKPIQEDAAFAEALADGDLTRQVAVDQDDEMGDLAKALNAMSSHLNMMIRQISEGVGTLADSSGSMSAIAAQMLSGAENTVSKSNTVAAASEEMNVNMESIAAAMEQASTNVKTVASSAAEISDSLEKVTQSTSQAQDITMEAVSKTEQASSQVHELGEAAEEIGMVTETIKAISDKTNLLALNATIEAARAGDAGKGFAVVANEIKDLAQQTAEATEDIAKKLKGVQKSTSDTVQEIGDVTEVINQVAEIVATITEAVSQQNDTTSEISENVMQASQGLDEINENVNQTSQAVSQVAAEISEVNEGASEISNSSAMVRQSAQELGELAETLKKMVQQFTL